MKRRDLVTAGVSVFTGVAFFSLFARESSSSQSAGSRDSQQAWDMTEGTRESTIAADRAMEETTDGRSLEEIEQIAAESPEELSDEEAQRLLVAHTHENGPCPACLAVSGFGGPRR